MTCNLHLGSEYTFPASQILHMGYAYVGYYSYIGFNYLAEPVDFPERIHAHLQNHCIHGSVKREYRYRKTYGIIEVFQISSAPVLPAQGIINHISCRCLAHTPCYGDFQHIKRVEIICGKLPHGIYGIIHFYDIGISAFCRITPAVLMRYKNGTAPFFKDLRYISVPVLILTYHGDEHIARTAFPRIVSDACYVVFITFPDQGSVYSPDYFFYRYSFHITLLNYTNTPCCLF